VIVNSILLTRVSSSAFV